MRITLDTNVLVSAFIAKHYIVSGDDHLLKLRKFRGIRIVNPKEMIDILGRSFPELIYDF
jgi:predicted nucleic acid-binding protein